MSLALQELMRSGKTKSQRDVPYLIMAKLTSLGFSFEEVWMFTHLNAYALPKKESEMAMSVKQATVEDKIPYKTALNDLREKTPIAYAEDVQAANEPRTSQEDKPKSRYRLDIKDKESILIELQRRYEETGDTKLLAQAAELQRMKNEETKDDVKHVMHFLPARCNSCPCFKVAKELHPDIKTLEP